VLALTGELDMATADVLEERLQHAARAKESVLLDLTDLAFMDSSGLRALLRASADARRDGWAFAVKRPPRHIWRVVEVTGVAPLLSLVDG
jgi:anti-anti-sigma factor